MMDGEMAPLASISKNTLLLIAPPPVMPEDCQLLLALVSQNFLLLSLSL